jgi:galactokinase
MTDRLAALKDKFQQLYGTNPARITKGPGRVDLMGIHTDYNDGFVLPVAISFEVIAAGKLRDDRTVRMYSSNFDSMAEFSLDDISFDEVTKWSNYPRGILVCLQQAGIELRGVDVALEGNVPVGASLSSSAAIEMATGMLFQSLLGFEMSGPDLAVTGQRAENTFVGINSGIMDQFISRLGQKDHALFLDCRTLDYELLPLDTGAYKIVICDTMKRRALAQSGEYNARRAQCEEAVRILKQWLPDIKALRDVTSADLEKYGDKLSQDVWKRAKHVIGENERVLASRDALEEGRVEDLAMYMNQGHDSARDYYEVSCFELEAMVSTTRSAPGSLCGRLCGAGFGGATVSIVREDSLDEFMRVVPKGYKEKTGIDPQLYICTAEDGASVIE